MLSMGELAIELAKIRQLCGDRHLRPDDVVAEAADPNHKLHDYFEWNDTRAAHQHRLQQARVLICRCRVVNPEAANLPPVPAYVSLVKDRKRDSGGYRPIADVLSDDDLRQQLRETAINELKAWTRRYKMLTDLVEMVEEVIEVA